MNNDDKAYYSAVVLSAIIGGITYWGFPNFEFRVSFLFFILFVMILYNTHFVAKSLRKRRKK